MTSLNQLSHDIADALVEGPPGVYTFRLKTPLPDGLRLFLAATAEDGAEESALLRSELRQLREENARLRDETERLWHEIGRLWSAMPES